MTPTCVHQQRQEFSADCIFCREIQQHEAEVISTYTDAEALEDGFLAELHSPALFRELPINRMTQHLFDDLAPFVEDRATLFNGDFYRALASILREKCRFATGDQGNTGEIGDIYTIPPKLWLVRNEVGGWTAMFPEDY